MLDWLLGNNGILGALKRLFSKIKTLVHKIIKGALQFAAHVLNWFKRKVLKKGIHVPFVVKGKTLKELLQTAPVQNVGVCEKEAIANAIYNEETEEIEDYEVVAADSIDTQTENLFKEGDELVVLG